MKKGGYNNTFYGFILFKDKNEKVLYYKLGSYCSQSVWEYPTIVGNVDHICFAFPSDWCINGYSNDPFMHHYCKIGSDMFGVDLSYKYKKNWNDFGGKYDRIQVIRLRATTYDYSDNKPTNDAYIANKGDLIANDEWMEFKLDVSKFNNTTTTRNKRAYAAFCYIRYLFCDCYHSLVKDFLILLRNRGYYTVANASNFELFQLTHHLDIYYYANFGFLELIGSNNYLKKLISQEKFLNLLDEGNGLQSSFGEGLSNLLRKDADILLRNGNIKEIYERIKSA